MKLDVRKVKNNDTIAIYTPFKDCEENAMLMRNIKIKCIESGLYNIKDCNGCEFIFDEDKDLMFSSLEEAIDRLRYIDYISNFNETTITYYLPYLMHAIDYDSKLYGIRYNKKLKKNELIIGIIRGIKYDDYGYGNWKIKLEIIDKNQNRKTVYFNANSLGKKLFFSYENAKSRIK